MSIFHHQVSFSPVDPLGDGLGDEIAAEQSESEAIELEDQLDSRLADNWQTVLDESRNDPDFVDLFKAED